MPLQGSGHAMSFSIINTALIICCGAVMILIYRTLASVRLEIQAHREREQKKIEHVHNQAEQYRRASSRG